jgi:glycosyltransferase involved in cell wall biosynthesis
VLRILERWSIRLADLALTPNIAFKKLFVSRSCRSDKMQIVMNSPEEQIFDPVRVGSDQDLLSNGQEFRIMHHGTLVHRHGIDILVEAIARIRSKIPGAYLDLYGSPTPFLETVLDLAKRLGVADIIHYHGPKSQTEIACAIQRCHLGVVPNRRSAFTEINLPTRLFEYLAMNRPVIAPNTQGIRDYFNPEHLFVFEPDNVDDLAAKILLVRAQPQTVKKTIECGRRVYRENLWSEEKVRFVEHVAALLRAKAE